VALLYIEAAQSEARYDSGGVAMETEKVSLFKKNPRGLEAADMMTMRLKRCKEYIFIVRA
jgi:hypothetical protein